MKTLSLRRHAVHALPAAALLLASFIVPSTARADVSPPDPDSCTGPLGSPKAEGSPCASKGTSGTCEYAETRYLPIPNIRDEAGAPSRSIRCVDKSGNVLDLVSGEEAVKSDPPDGGAGAGGATSASSSST